MVISWKSTSGKKKKEVMSDVQQDLHRCHLSFEAKMEDYANMRWELRFMNLRHKRIRFVSSKTNHQAILGDTIAHILETSEVAALPFGGYVLDFVTGKLLSHAEAYRLGEARFNTDHIYGKIMEPDQFNPMSNERITFIRQSILLNRLGQDIEAMALIKYCDKILLDSGEIDECDALPEDHPILELTYQSESALKKLRNLVIG